LSIPDGRLRTYRTGSATLAQKIGAWRFEQIGLDPKNSAAHSTKKTIKRKPTSKTACRCRSAPQIGKPSRSQTTGLFLCSSSRELKETLSEDVVIVSCSALNAAIEQLIMNATSGSFFGIESPISQMQFEKRWRKARKRFVGSQKNQISCVKLS
jgi:hypothetical protein